MIVCDSRDRDVWLSERTKSVGASDTLDNTSLRRKAGLEKPFEGNIHTEAGHALEGSILYWYGEKTDTVVTPCGFLLRNINTPWMHATPDGFWVDKRQLKIGVVEIKNVGLNQAQEWLQMPEFKKTELSPKLVVTKYQAAMIAAEPAKTPPKKYWQQVQHQLHITCLDSGYLVGLIGGKRLVSFLIERDQKYIDKRIKDSKDFMERVNQLKEEKNAISK